MHASIVVLLIFLFSCNTKHESSLLQKRWLSTQIIKLEQNFKLDTFVTKPKSIYNPLMKIGFINKDNEVFYDCLYYRPKTKEGFGSFKVIKNPKNISCEKLVLNKPIYQLKEIYNFKINIESHKLKIYIDKEVLDIKLVNYGAYPHKLYQAPIRETAFKSVSYISDIRDKILYENEPIEDGKICLKVNDDCSLAINNCSSCKSTWYEVMNSKCPTKYSRVCGKSECGQKNSPACLRGVTTVGMDTYLYCVNDSPFGFCQKGLRVICINNTLVCK